MDGIYLLSRIFITKGCQRFVVEAGDMLAKSPMHRNQGQMQDPREGGYYVQER
jgi:hypothetical protein